MEASALTCQQHSRSRHSARTHHADAVAGGGVGAPHRAGPVPVRRRRRGAPQRTPKRLVEEARAGPGQAAARRALRRRACEGQSRGRERRSAEAPFPGAPRRTAVCDPQPVPPLSAPLRCTQSMLRRPRAPFDESDGSAVAARAHDDQVHAMTLSLSHSLAHTPSPALTRVQRVSTLLRPPARRRHCRAVGPRRRAHQRRHARAPKRSASAPLLDQQPPAASAAAAAGAATAVGQQLLQRRLLVRRQRVVPRLRRSCGGAAGGGGAGG